TGSSAAAPVTSFFPRGAGSKEPVVCIRCRMKESDYDPRFDEFSDEAHAAADELDALVDDRPQGPLSAAEYRAAMTIAATALELSAKHGLHPLALAGQFGFRGWAIGDEREHMAGCTDPKCEWRCCRLRLGWTMEEIQADIDAHINATRRKRTSRRSSP